VNQAAWLQAAWVNLILAGLCLWMRLLSPSGCAAAFLIGGLVWGSLGAPGWIVLLAFFLGGTAATKFRFKEKQALGVAFAISKKMSQRGTQGHFMFARALDSLEPMAAPVLEHELALAFTAHGFTGTMA